MIKLIALTSPLDAWPVISSYHLPGLVTGKGSQNKVFTRELRFTAATWEPLLSCFG